jgi:hypothetical protein
MITGEVRLRRLDRGLGLLDQRLLQHLLLLDVLDRGARRVDIGLRLGQRGAIIVAAKRTSGDRL